VQGLSSAKAWFKIAVLILTEQISSAVPKAIFLCIIVIIVTHHIVQDFIRVGGHLIVSMSKTAKRSGLLLVCFTSRNIGHRKTDQAHVCSGAPFPIHTRAFTFF
jgi:hypothetical protein